MREFLQQCLEDLDTFAGIRQLYWLMEECKKTSDDPQKEYARKKANLVTGMVLACNEYPMIPDKDKEKIIRSQMAKDHDYDGLNSRIIHKWLGAAFPRYVKTQNHFEDKGISEEEMKPLKPETEKMINDFIRKLSGNFQPAISKEGVEAEKKKILQEDEQRQGKKALSTGYKPKPPDPLQALINQYVLKTKGALWFPPKIYQIEGLLVPGESEAHAHEILNAVLSSSEEQHEQR